MTMHQCNVVDSRMIEDYMASDLKPILHKRNASKHGLSSNSDHKNIGITIS